MSDKNPFYIDSVKYLISDHISKNTEFLETNTDLSLWINTQFTSGENPIIPSFDQTQGSTHEKNSSLSEVFAYEDFLNYLDPEYYNKESEENTVTEYTRNSAGSHYPSLLPKLLPESHTGSAAVFNENEIVLNNKATLSYEEEKKKRNTEASARFRIKRKIKEQDAKKSVEEMTQKSKDLEDRVHSLEKEISWLRSILTEKTPCQLR